MAATTIVITPPADMTSTAPGKANYTATVDAPVVYALSGSAAAIANEIAALIKRDLK